MDIAALLQFLFLADHEAIRAIATDPASPLIGALFVLAAALARNHCRHDLLHQPWRIATPFAASLITAGALFIALHAAAWLHGAPRPGLFASAASFLGLYWATAPLAWLYGVPFEWIVGIDRGARVRLAALGVVAGWRIALFYHVLLVLLDGRWVAVVAVLAFTECALVLLALLRFRPVKDRQIRPSVSSSLLIEMGGLTVPVGVEPEDTKWIDASSDADVYVEAVPRRDHKFVDTASGYVAASAAIGFLVSIPLLWLCSFSTEGWIEIVSARRAGAALDFGALLFALVSLSCWLAFCIGSQPAQRRKSKVEALFAQNRIAEALSYMNAQQRSAFPAQWEPPPTEAYNATPKLLDVAETLVMQENADWVEGEYAERLLHFASQPVWYLYDQTASEQLIRVVEKSPNRAALARAALHGIETHEPFVARCRELWNRLAKYRTEPGWIVPERDRPFWTSDAHASDAVDFEALKTRFRAILGR